MPVKCEQYNQVCVMSVDGDFMGDLIPEAKKVVEDHIDSKQIVSFVVDFEKSGFIDSEGLETLLWMRKRCDELFGQIKLVHLDENLKKILEITRLTNRFECHADLAAAVKTMR